MQQSKVKYRKLKPESSFQDLSCISQGSLSVTIIHSLVHDLAQPITSSSLYIRGCINRLAAGNQDPEFILHIMKKAMQDIEEAQKIVLHMKNYIHQY